jgi:hypothetical protein
LLGVLASRQRGDDPCWRLFIAYDCEQPAIRPDASPVKPCAVWSRVGFVVIGVRHSGEHRVEMAGDLGVVASDLLLPDPGEEKDLTAVRVQGSTDDRLAAWHDWRLS